MAIVDKNIDKEPKWYVLHVFSGYENITLYYPDNCCGAYDYTVSLDAFGVN